MVCIFQRSVRSSALVVKNIRPSACCTCFLELWITLEIDATHETPRDPPMQFARLMYGIDPLTSLYNVQSTLHLSTGTRGSYQISRGGLMAVQTAAMPSVSRSKDAFPWRLPLPYFLPVISGRPFQWVSICIPGCLFRFFLYGPLPLAFSFSLSPSVTVCARACLPASLPAVRDITLRVCLCLVCMSILNVISVITTQTGTRNNAQSGSNFLITFFFEHGHIPPQRLSSGFDNGAHDEFAFNLPATGLGEFQALKIANTGNDGWRLERLTALYGRYRSSPTQVSWDYDQWIDGDGSSATAPASDFFYADGSWASNPSLSAFEMGLVCPCVLSPCLQGHSARLLCEANLTHGGVAASMHLGTSSIAATPLHRVQPN